MEGNQTTRLHIALYLHGCAPLFEIQRLARPPLTPVRGKRWQNGSRGAKKAGPMLARLVVALSILADLAADVVVPLIGLDVCPFSILVLLFFEIQA